jgi:hypothetical protein
VTEKLVPSLESDDGWAFTTPELVTIVICCTDAPKDPIAPVVPLIVAKQVLAIPVLSVPYDAFPKSARGSMPPLEEGASAIHSADDRCAPLTLADVLEDWPVVASLMETTNERPLKDASAEMRSPG